MNLEETECQGADWIHLAQDKSSEADFYECDNETLVP
jgi:hypothetical protein